mmetsp:Transcript_26374/g.48181  ORF Transcript_26374/g.48181 Transcript_26374/m.48181 type:complete len:756 (+) Transcript_26374:76-2343(+)
MAEEEAEPVRPRLRRLRRVAVVEQEADGPLFGNDVTTLPNEGPAPSAPSGQPEPSLPHMPAAQAGLEANAQEGGTAPSTQTEQPRTRRRRALRLVTAEELELAQGGMEAALANRGSSERTLEEEAAGIRAFREKLSQQETRRQTRRALSVATTEDVELAQEEMGLTGPKRQRGALAGLVDSEEESEEHEAAQGLRNANVPVPRAKKHKADRQPCALLEERELVFPTRQPLVRTASNDLFDEEEDDEARFIRQRSTLQKLRSRLQDRKVRATPSHAVDLMKVQKDLSAPQMTFDLEDEHEHGDALAVDMPEELTEKVSKRTLWKEQLARTKSRQWAEALCGTDLQEQESQQSQREEQLQQQHEEGQPDQGSEQETDASTPDLPEPVPANAETALADAPDEEPQAASCKTLALAPPQRQPQPEAVAEPLASAHIPGIMETIRADTLSRPARPGGTIAQMLGVTYRRTLRKRRRLRQLREEEVRMEHLDLLVAAQEEKARGSGGRSCLEHLHLHSLPQEQKTHDDDACAVAAAQVAEMQLQEELGDEEAVQRGQEEEDDKVNPLENVAEMRDPSGELEAAAGGCHGIHNTDFPALMKIFKARIGQEDLEEEQVAELLSPAEEKRLLRKQRSYLRHRAREVKQIDKKLRWEVRDALQIDDSEKRALFLGTSTMSAEEQQRYRSIVDTDNSITGARSLIKRRKISSMAAKSTATRPSAVTHRVLLGSVAMDKATSSLYGLGNSSSFQKRFMLNTRGPKVC